MMRKKITISILIAVVAIVIIATILVFGRKGPPPIEEQLDLLLSNGDGVNIVSEDGEKIDSLQGGITATKIYESIEYSVLSEEVNGSNANFEVQFTTPDIVRMAESFSAEHAEKQDIDFNSWLIDALDTEYATTKKTISLAMVYQNRDWALVANNDLYDVLTGGALNYYADQQKKSFEAWKEIAES